MLSTLFPSAPGIYRPFGYELVGSYDVVEVPVGELATVRPPASTITTRRATAADFDAVRDVYDTWAAAQNGPLTRRGASFPATADEFVGDVHRRHPGGRRGRDRGGLLQLGPRDRVRRGRRPSR